MSIATHQAAITRMHPPARKSGSVKVLRRLMLAPRLLAAGLLGAYKALLSPLLPPACRFQPTCSEYFREAVIRLGVLRGARLGVWRLLRCHPFSRGGFDPVPPSTAGGQGRVDRPAAPEDEARRGPEGTDTVNGPKETGRPPTR